MASLVGLEEHLQDVASARLDEIFSATIHNNSDTYIFPAEEALSLLRAYPALALQQFSGGHLPIVYFIKAQVGVDEITQLVALNHASCGVAIEAVAKYGCQDGVLEILVDDILMDGDDSSINEWRICETLRTSALEFFEAGALERTDDELINVLKIFLEIDPHTILGDYDDHFGCEISSGIPQRGLAGEFGVPVMNFLVSEYKKVLESEIELSVRPLNAEFGSAQAAAVEELFVHCKLFRCFQDNWTSRGVVSLLNAIGTDSTIKIFGFDVPPSFFNGNDSPCCQALDAALATNTTLTTFQYMSQEQGPADATVNAITRSLAQNSKIEWLSLFEVSLSEPSLFSSFLSNCQIPTLHFSKLVLNTMQSEIDYQPSCRIEFLLLQDLKPADLHLLASKLHQVPTLEHLQLWYNKNSQDSTDVTVPLYNSFGSHRGSLQKLTLQRVVIDVGVLAQTLRNNMLLQHLVLDGVNPGSEVALISCAANHVEKYSTAILSVSTDYSLKDSPATLALLPDSWIRRPDEAPPKAQVMLDYFVALNQNGWRALAAKPTFTLPILLNILCCIKTLKHNKAIDEELNRLVADPRHAVIYGFLRMAPHLWSAVA